MSLFTAQLDRHAQALDLLSQRQKLLAGNIANADTPGFKARDFDFAQTLAQVRSTTRTGSGFATQAGHLQANGAPAGALAPEVMYRDSVQPALDGNTVDLDRERAQFADNAMRYEATLRFINHDVRSMLSAITGQ